MKSLLLALKVLGPELRKESRPLVTEAAGRSDQAPKQAPEKKGSRLVRVPANVNAEIAAS